MKLTIAEAVALLTKQLDVEIEIQTEVEPTTVPTEAKSASDGWVVNSKTSVGHPSNLGPCTIIDVMLSDGTQSDCFYANDLVYLWDVTRQCHIVKYRVVE